MLENVKSAFSRHTRNYWLEQLVAQIQTKQDKRYKMNYGVCELTENKNSACRQG